MRGREAGQVDPMIEDHVGLETGIGEEQPIHLRHAWVQHWKSPYLA